MKKELGIGVFVALAAIGITYTLTSVPTGYSPYYCNESNVVGLCWKLSNPNADGFSTRCYYNQSAPTRYKNCRTGWETYKGQIIGNETNVTEGEDVIVNVTTDRFTLLAEMNMTRNQLPPIKCNNNVCERITFRLIGAVNSTVDYTPNASLNITELGVERELKIKEAEDKAIQRYLLNKQKELDEQEEMRTIVPGGERIVQEVSALPRTP